MIALQFRMKIVDVFDDPIRRQFDILRAEQDSNLKIFNEAVREIRVSPPYTELWPFEIEMIYLTNTFKQTELQQHVIDAVHKQIFDCLDPAKVKLNKLSRSVSADRISLMEYEATQLLNLDHISYDGDSQIGLIRPNRG